MTKVDLILGVRPDIIRASALLQAFSGTSDSLELRPIFTGQHYDEELSRDLIQELDYPHSLKVLNFLPGDDTQRLSNLMLTLSEQFQLERPDMVMVIGNSDSALAAAQVASRSNIPVAHLDAGIRYDRSDIREEQNDILIDQLSLLKFTSSEEGTINLIREGHDQQQVIDMGNLRADAVFHNLGHAEDSVILEMSGLTEGQYILVALHHAETLNDPDFMSGFFGHLEVLSESLPIYIVMHPRTSIVMENIPGLDLYSQDNMQYVNSRPYRDMLKLLKNTRLLITDSQGLQEESTILGVPCLSVGVSTNRTLTVMRGTNTFAGLDLTKLKTSIDEALEGHIQEAHPIPGWDGKAAQRLLEYLTARIS